MQPESMSSSDEAQTGEIDANSGSTYAERRKWSKPVMEKRRRARINSSLNELKSILLEALKKDSTRHSKLEKADILEMTVKYLKNVNAERQRLSVSLNIDPAVVDKYKAGFNECRNEVMRFLSTCEGVTVDVRTRLLSRLATCSHSIQSPSSAFDDSNFDTTPIQSAFVSSGNIQPIPIKIKEPNSIQNVLTSETFPSTNISRPIARHVGAGLDNKLSNLFPDSAVDGSGTVLQSGIQLTPAMNSFAGSGNVALFLPSHTPKATFIAPIASVSSTAGNDVHSSEASVGKLQTSPVTSSKQIFKEYSSGSENNISPRGTNIIVLQPVFQPVVQSRTSPVNTNESSVTSDSSSNYHGTKDQGLPSPNFSASPQRYKNRSIEKSYGSSEKNISDPKIQDQLVKEKTISFKRDNRFNGNSKRVVEIRPLQKAYQPLQKHQPRETKNQNISFPISITDDEGHLLQNKSDKIQSVCNSLDDSEERLTKRRRLSKSNSNGISVFPINHDRPSSRQAIDNQYSDEASSSYGIKSSEIIPIGISVTSPLNFQSKERLSLSSDINSIENVDSFVSMSQSTSISPHAISNVGVSHSSAINPNPNPWRPWSKSCS